MCVFIYTCIEIVRKWLPTFTSRY